MKLHSKAKGFAFETLLLVVVLGAAFYFLYRFGVSKCNEPVRYSIGAVDSRFKISKAEATTIAKEAGDRWNQQSGQKVLVYDPASDLKINMIYDDRQAEVDKISTLSNSIEKNKSSVEKSKQALENAWAQYQKDVTAYNQQISYWNGQGGAPGDVYNSLLLQKSTLDHKREELLKLADTLNVKVDDYNSRVDSLNSEINQRKGEVITQGLYKPAEDRIEIYTFGDKDELLLVLMHELGHSLGLDHDKNSDSLMYYLLKDQNDKNPTLTAEDKSMLSNRCDIKNLRLFRKSLPSATY